MTPVKEPPRLSPKAARRAMLFVLLMGASVLLGFLPVPWMVVSALTAVAAMVVGVMTMVAMRRSATMGLWILMVLGLGLAASMTLVAASSAVLQEELSEYQECQRYALTIKAQRACESTLEEASEARRLEFEKEVYERLGLDPPAAPSQTPSPSPK